MQCIFSHILGRSHVDVISWLLRTIKGKAARPISKVEMNLTVLYCHSAVTPQIRTVQLMQCAKQIDATLNLTHDTTTTELHTVGYKCERICKLPWSQSEYTAFSLSIQFE